MKSKSTYNSDKSKPKSRGANGLVKLGKDIMPLQEQMFVTEYLIDHNGTQSAIRAGYAPSSAALIACKLFAKPRVQDAIRKEIEAQKERLRIDSDRVKTELARIAFVDLREAYDEKGALRPLNTLPENVIRAVIAVETDEIFEQDGKLRTKVGETVKLKLADKVRALELLGKHLRLFPEQREHTGPNGQPISVKPETDGTLIAVMGKLSDEVLKKLADRL